MSENEIIYVVKTYHNKERFRTTDAKKLVKHSQSRGKCANFQTEDGSPKFLKHTMTYIRKLPTKRRPFTVIEFEFMEQW